MIRAHLTPDQIREAVIYRDLKTISAGERVVVGSQAHIMPFDGILLFADLAPQFNWAHPCLFILVQDGGPATKLIKASFPPRGREFPKQFKIIMQNGHKVFDASQLNS